MINYTKNNGRYSNLADFKNLSKKENENMVEIDPIIYKYLNEKYIINQDILLDIKNNGVENGYIYSCKQLKNQLGIEKIYTDGLSFYTIKDEKEIDLRDITNELYDKDFSYFINDIDCIIDNIINQTGTIICSFIGDYNIGRILIEKLINSDKITLSNIFIFRKKEYYDKLKDMLDKFNNKIIFLSKEYGNDIIPTLQALNYYDSKYEYSNLIKLQTKSNIDWFNECSDYLINNTIEYLEAKYINRCNCVSHPKYYIRIDGDKYCKDLYEKYNDNITNKYFVAGTIFYTNKNNIFNIINFMRANNYRSYFINNMYDNNAVNISNSPIHFGTFIWYINYC